MPEMATPKSAVFYLFSFEIYIRINGVFASRNLYLSSLLVIVINCFLIEPTFASGGVCSSD